MVGTLKLFLVLLLVGAVTIRRRIVLVFAFHLFLFVEVRNVPTFLVVHFLPQFWKQFSVVHGGVCKQFRVFNLVHVLVNLVALEYVFVQLTVILVRWFSNGRSFKFTLLRIKFHLRLTKSIHLGFGVVFWQVGFVFIGAIYVSSVVLNTAPDF